MNATTIGMQTALHLAVHQGHSRIVERLVGFGVDMNVPDSDGNIALHLAVVKDSVDAFSTDTPQLKKVGSNIWIEAQCSVFLTLTVCLNLVIKAGLHVAALFGHILKVH